jgi:citrate synthase
MLTRHSMIHEDMKHFFDGYPSTAHPMAILSRWSARSRATTPTRSTSDNKDVSTSRSRASSSKVRTIAAFSYKKSIGQPFVYPQNSLSYCANFLNMMFAVPAEPYEIDEEIVKVLNLLLILHADHEQNCSTSTVRLVGSSKANLFASIAAGICALWGPLHGGANQEVVEMLERSAGRRRRAKFVKLAKDKNSNFRLMGFGHRVYKNYDPRAKIIKVAADKVLASSASTTRCSTSPASSKKRPSRTRTSSTASSTRTSTSTAASSTARSASPRTCSPSCSRSAACPAGSPTGRR